MYVVILKTRVDAIKKKEKKWLYVWTYINDANVITLYFSLNDVHVSTSHFEYKWCISLNITFAYK